MLQFSSRPQPRLSKANFANTDVHFFIEHIYQLIRAETFDETVMETHIDEESIQVPERVHMMSMVIRSRREGSSSTSQGTARSDELNANSSL
jgi:hypothetical protein